MMHKCIPWPVDMNDMSCRTDLSASTLWYIDLIIEVWRGQWYWHHPREQKMGSGSTPVGVHVRQHFTMVSASHLDARPGAAMGRAVLFGFDDFQLCLSGVDLNRCDGLNMGINFNRLRKCFGQRLFRAFVGTYRENKKHCHYGSESMD